MIDAKLLATSIDKSNPVELWGTWIPRQADNVIFAVELVTNYLTDLTVEVFEKDYSDVGDGLSSAVSVAYASEIGIKTMTRIGAKELVRVKVSLSRSVDLPELDVGLVLVRFLQPVWFETEKA